MTEELKDAQGAAKNLGLDPLVERPLVDLLASVPKRLVTMITKLLSLKGVVFGVATLLLVNGKLPDWAWLTSTLILIFGEKALGIIKDIRG